MGLIEGIIGTGGERILQRRDGGRGARGVESVDPGQLYPEGVTVELVLISLILGRGEGARGITGRVLGTCTEIE